MNYDINGLNDKTTSNNVYIIKRKKGIFNNII